MNRRESLLVTACLLLSVFVGLGPGDTARAQATRGAYTDVRKLPDGPVGECITELIDTVNANDPENVRKFLTERATPQFRDLAPMEEHQAVFADVYQRSRGLTFYGVRKYEEETPADEVVVIVHNKLTEGWQAFVMNVEQKPPHRLAGLQFAPARPPK